MDEIARESESTLQTRNDHRGRKRCNRKKCTSACRCSGRWTGTYAEGCVKPNKDDVAPVPAWSNRVKCPRGDVSYDPHRKVCVRMIFRTSSKVRPQHTVCQSRKRDMSEFCLGLFPNAKWWRSIQLVRKKQIFWPSSLAINYFCITSPWQGVAKVTTLPFQFHFTTAL